MILRLSLAFWGLLVAQNAVAFSDAELRTVNFVQASLRDFIDPAAKATVLYFATEQCPLVRQYYPTLIQLKEQLPKGEIQFLGIYSAKSTDTFSMAQQAMDLNVPFRVLHDFESQLAKELNVKTTTEVVVVDQKGQVKYRGPIDDRFKVGGRKPAPTRHYLKDALTQLLANQEITPPDAKASGCVIPYYDATEAPSRQVTYYEDVAPIIQKKCQTCHRPGEVGAVFDTFMDYASVSNHAQMILQVVQEGRMPPSYTIVNSKFLQHANDRRLTKEEIGIIDDWVKGGTKAGDPTRAPKPVVWPGPGWKIGKPDVVLEMEKPYVLPATGLLAYQFFKLRMNYPEDKWIQAVEIQPGNKEVVHHAELHVVKSDDEDYSGDSGMMKVYGFTGDKAVMLAGFVPGDDDENARVYPKGKAIKLPKGHDLVLEMHYTTTGKVTSDRSRAGLIFAKDAPTTELCNHTFRLARNKLIVPANSEHAVGQKELWFKKDVLLHSFRGHMHKIGKSWKLEWKTPNPGGTMLPPVLEFFAGIPTWDFNWQRSFELKEPLKIPAGQVILMTGTWDNSKHHPYNEDPQREKGWGIHTSDEMLNTRVKFSIINNEGGKISCLDVVP